MISVFHQFSLGASGVFLALLRWAALTKAGTNVLKLTLPAGGLTSGILYDYLRLELDEDAKPPK